MCRVRCAGFGFAWQWRRVFSAHLLRQRCWCRLLKRRGWCLGAMSRRLDIELRLTAVAATDFEAFTVMRIDQEVHPGVDEVMLLRPAVQGPIRDGIIIVSPGSDEADGYLPVGIVEKIHAGRIVTVSDE